MSVVRAAAPCLAVFPVVIKDVERYSNSVTGRDIRDLTESLKNNELMFVSALEVLLRSTVPAAQLSILLSDFQGELWRDYALCWSVSRQLGQEGDVILDKINEIHKIISKLRSKLPEHNSDTTIRGPILRASFVIKCFVRGPQHKASLVRLMILISEFRVQTNDAIVHANTLQLSSRPESRIEFSHQRLAQFLLPQPEKQHDIRHRPEKSKTVFLTLYEFEEVPENSATIEVSPGSLRSSATPQWRLKGPSHFNDHQPYAESNAHIRVMSPGRILFLRGYPSSSWLRTIGSIHLVDPEFFSRWLDFPHANERHNEFHLPTLRPDDWNLLELPMVSIGRREGVNPLSRADVIDAARRRSEVIVRNYHNRLCSPNEGTVGNSVARDVYTFDNTLFAIEQKITILLQPQRGLKGWTLFVWADAGDDLGEDLLDRIENIVTRGSQSIRRYCLWPFDKYRFKGCQDSNGPESTHLSNAMTNAGQMPPPASRLHLGFGENLYTSLMVQDPFYALHEILMSTAESQRKLLNMISHRLTQHMFQSSTVANTRPNLKYLKAVLLRQMQHIKHARASIRNADSPKWPKSNSAAAAGARSRVEQGYTALYEEVQALDRQCQDVLTILTNGDTVQDAQMTAKLTILAFLFVPLSFTTSFFGMNFQELEDLSIWKWFAMTVPIMLAILFVMVVDIVRYWNCCVDCLKRMF